MFFLLQAETPDESATDKIEDWLLDHGLTILGIAIFVFVAIIVINIVVPRLVRVTTRTRLEQGPIIKSQLAESGASPQRRAAVSLQPRPPRLIDAA